MIRIIGMLAWLSIALPAWAQSVADKRSQLLTEQAKAVQLIELCNQAGYERQAAYWRVVRDAAGQRLHHLDLSERDPATLSQDEARQLAELDARLTRSAAAEVKRVDDALGDVEAHYGWHLARMSLLRELTQRVRRLHFYINESTRSAEGGWGNVTPDDVVRFARADDAGAVDPATAVQTLGPAIGSSGRYRAGHRLQTDHDTLVNATRRWVEAYGDLYFKPRELAAQGRLDNAASLLRDVERLAEKLMMLEARRDALITSTLQVLRHFDPDAKVELPTAQPITLDDRGVPEQFVMCMDTGHAGAMDGRRMPLCPDVVDFVFYPPRMTPTGEVDVSHTKVAARLRSVTEDIHRDLLLKQSVNTNSHGNSTSLVLPPGADEAWRVLNDEGQRGGHVNIWHAAARATALGRLNAVAAFMQKQPGFMLYDKLLWEPAFAASVDANRTRLAGYSPEARLAFQQFAKKHYETIDALNAAWSTKYKHFDEVEPPPDPMRVPRRWATAQTHLFEQFRIQSYIDWLNACTDALTEADPGRAVSVEVQTVNANFPFAASDPYRMMCALRAPLIEDHYNNWFVGATALRLLYDLCTYAGKTPVEMEYIWTYPRLELPATEDAYRVTGELSLWRRAVWGRRMVHLFGSYDGWGYNHHYMDERFATLDTRLGPTGRVVREAATGLVCAKQRVRRFWPILRSTHVALPRVAVIFPAASIVNEYPYHAPFSAYGTTTGEVVKWHRFLSDEDLDVKFVPEQVVIEGKQKLNAFDVVILPYMPYFPKGFGDALQTYLAGGGLVISGGVSGLLTETAAPNDPWTSAMFGEHLSHDYNGNDTVWQWNLTAAAAGPWVEIEKVGGQSALVARDFGKGRMLLIDRPLDPSDALRNVKTQLIHAVKQRVRSPLVTTIHDRFECVLRTDGEGRQYLFVTNPSLDTPQTDVISVHGEFNRVMDYGISRTCAVPLLPREPMTVNGRALVTTPDSDGTLYYSLQSAPGRTSWQLRLEPGEATVFALEPK